MSEKNRPENEDRTPIEEENQAPPDPKQEEADGPTGDVDEGESAGRDKEAGEGETDTDEGDHEAEASKTEEDEDLKTKYVRLAADFQNFRRRSDKEKSDIYAYANEKFVVELLDVIDNFERAIAHATGEKSNEKILEGMEMILKQLMDVLKKNHVEEIAAEGQQFDPNFHNAVMTESVEGMESGTITNVLQKGYMLNKKVIRPSMVAVAQ